MATPWFTLTLTLTKLRQAHRITTLWIALNEKPGAPLELIKGAHYSPIVLYE